MDATQIETPIRPQGIEIDFVPIGELNENQRTAIGRISSEALPWHKGAHIGEKMYADQPFTYVLLARKGNEIVGFTSYMINQSSGIDKESFELDEIQYALQKGPTGNPETLALAAENAYTEVQRRTAYVMDSAVSQTFQGQGIYRDLQEGLIEAIQKYNKGRPEGDGILFLTRHANLDETKPFGEKSLAQSTQNFFGERVVYKSPIPVVDNYGHKSNYMRIFIGKPDQWHTYAPMFPKANPANFRALPISRAA